MPSEAVARAYALKSKDEAKSLYDEWAKNYDADLESADYASPSLAVDAIIDHLRDIPQSQSNTIKALDAGCGTGLVGALLAKGLANLGFKLHIEGLDLSSGMLEAARQKECYTKLEEADLTVPLKRDDGSFGLVVCVGTLTKGHVGPAVINEFARVASKDGLIVFTVMQSIFVSGGYSTLLQKMADGGTIEVLQKRLIGFTRDVEDDGCLVVARKL